MKREKLMGKIAERGYNVALVAAEMGIDRSGLYRKLNGSDKFTIGEVKQIKNILDLSVQDAADIFLT